MMQELLTKPSITFVQPTGHINASNAIAFQQHLETVLNQPPYQPILVDMGQIESLDSAGLMALISVRSLAQQMGADLYLCSVPPALQIIFEVTQLDRVFRLYESRSAFDATLV